MASDKVLLKNVIVDCTVKLLYDSCFYTEVCQTYVEDEIAVTS